MKKNIVIGVLLVVTILSLAYGYMQKLDADRCIILAEQLAAKAEEYKKEAEIQKLTAEFQMHRAMQKNKE